MKRRFFFLFCTKRTENEENQSNEKETNKNIILYGTFFLQIHAFSASIKLKKIDAILKCIYVLDMFGSWTSILRFSKSLYVIMCVCVQFVHIVVLCNFNLQKSSRFFFRIPCGFIIHTQKEEKIKNLSFWFRFDTEPKSSCRNKKINKKLTNRKMNERKMRKIE